MDRKVAAILVNLFVCPGAGMWMLGYRGLGVVYIGAVLFLLFGLLAHFLMQISARVHYVNQLSQSVVDNTIQLTAHTWQVNSQLYLWGLIILSMVWIGSTIHVYFLDNKCINQ